MTVADGGDTVGANPCLIVGREEADESRQQAGAEDGSTLKHGDRLRKEALDDEVADEAVETLRAGDGRQNHVATEGAAVLFHRSDGGLTGNRSTDTARCARKAHHQRYADVAQNNCSCHFHNDLKFFSY